MRRFDAPPFDAAAIQYAEPEAGTELVLRIDGVAPDTSRVLRERNRLLDLGVDTCAERLRTC